MYENGQSVTLDSILTAVKHDSDIGFTGGRTTLSYLLRAMGFEWKKTDNRRSLMERNDIVIARSDFLMEYMKLKAEGYEFVFLDETWFYSKGYASRSWQDKNKESCSSKNLDEGKRYIVLHAGGTNGFIEDAELLFPSKTKEVDEYHGTMTAEMFQKWMKEMLLPRLAEPSVIVMDNAPVHSVLKVKRPSSKWRKGDLQQFLTEHNIPFRPEHTFKSLLLKTSEIVVQKRYVVDEMIQEAGHKVLRLPPYHCHYNPIELVWSQCKRYYHRHRGTTFDHQAVTRKWRQALNQVSVENWKNYVAHTEKITEEDWRVEVRHDASETSVIVNIQEDSDDDDVPLAVPIPGPSGVST
ncbi:hypothetical protein R5R35_002772 [Gryllus longicercus]|uniref:Tc1-like transposase DDE domain-containing protein n=1 Tax=Gryllus longicercus TaxID=2509291 RepID=A0AAN9ZF61_9ORTH